MDQKLQRWQKSLRRTNCPKAVLERTNKQIKEFQNRKSAECNTWKESFLTGALTLTMLYLILGQWKIKDTPRSINHAQSTGSDANQSQLVALQAGYSLAILGEAIISASEHTKLLLNSQTGKPISQSIQTVEHLINTKLKNHE